MKFYRIRKGLKRNIVSIILLAAMSVCFTLTACGQSKTQNELNKTIQTLDSLDLTFFTNWTFHHRTQDLFAWYYEGNNKYSCNLGQTDGRELISIANPKGFVKEYNLDLNVENVTAWLKIDRQSDAIIFTKSNYQTGDRDTIGVIKNNEQAFNVLNKLFNELLKLREKLAQAQITDVYLLDKEKSYLTFIIYKQKYSLIHTLNDVDEDEKAELTKKYKILKPKWWYFESAHDN